MQTRKNTSATTRYLLVLAHALALGSWAVGSAAVTAAEQMQDPAKAQAPEPSKAQVQESTTTQASAQKQEARTLVTGSRILRARPEHSLPLLELDRAYIDRSSAITATELLRSVPQAQSFGTAAPARGR